MVYVTMKDGRVLKYNDATDRHFRDKFITLIDSKHSIADIVIETIERIDWTRPCKIYQSKPKSKLPKI